MYQNNQDPSLPSGSDILRYIWTCRASAIYDIPINWRYIHKRCPALITQLNATISNCRSGLYTISYRHPCFQWQLPLYCIHQSFPECHPEDGWNTVTYLDNSQSSTATTFTFSQSIGMWQGPTFTKQPYLKWNETILILHPGLFYFLLFTVFSNASKFQE